MEKEINKPNDIFVSTLLNPTASVRDLFTNGINSSNTDLLTKDEYKNSPFVKKNFTDEKGVFNNEAFENAYNQAVNKKNELDEIQSYQDFSNYAKFNDNDILAPLNSPKTDRTYEIKKVRNPLLQSEGVSHLFGKGENDKSQRELAQMHKVWDSKNQKWLDYTAEDLGLKYLFKQSLAYAKWDEDGTHFDKSLGREVQHKKGEWKTDDDGLYYTETVDNNEAYGKEFVAFTDILTKEDSKLNKIDFFDSDDKHKSKFGTVMKTAAAIAPYFLVPYNAWGYLTASMGLLSALPTLAKMGEGIVVGDKETAFTKQMNTLENYWKKYNPSYSDEAQGSIINFESIMNTVSDVFGQLYQMRAAASLGNIYKTQYTAAEKEAYKKFTQEFGDKWAKIAEQNKDLFKTDKQVVEAFQDVWKTMAEASPYMKEAVQKSNKISKALSLGYMSLASGTETYQDAIQGGYDRRMAGTAALTAMAGQYALMMNNRMGDWFLEGITGDKEGISRKLLRDTLRPHYDKIAESARALAAETSAEGKAKIMSQILDLTKKAPRNFIDLIKYGGEEFWQKALIEGTEEVTEEAVMDMTKGVFDALSSFGVGKNSETASFGGWQNTFSKEGAERYLMNFIGGFVGGAMFPLQQKIEQRINNIVPEDAKSSIVNEIIKGNTNALLEEIDRMAKSDTLQIRDTSAMGEATGKTVTRGEMVGSVMKEYVKHLEGIIQDMGFTKEDWNTEPVFKKIVRDKMLQKVIEEAGIDTIIEEDFLDKVKHIIDLETELKSKQPQEEKSKENSKESKDSNKKESDKKEESESKEKPKEEFKITPEIEKLTQEIKEAKADLQDFINGKQGEDYLSQSLAFLQPQLRKALGLVSKEDYTQSVYGVSYQDILDGKIAKKASDVDKEYAEWKESTDNFEKFRKVGISALTNLEKEFSSDYKEYAGSDYAKTIRRNVLKNWLRNSNFSLGEEINDNQWRHALIKLSENLYNSGLPGVTLEDFLDLGPEIKNTISNKIAELNKEELNSLFEAADKTRIETLKTMSEMQGIPISEELLQPINKEDQMNIFEKEIFNELRSLPVEQITKEDLDNIIARTNTIRQLAVNIVNSAYIELGDNVTEVTLKNKVDEKLVNLGYPISASSAFNPESLEESAIEYVQDIISPKFSKDSDYDGVTSFSLSESVLLSYINNEDRLDAEIVKVVNTNLYKEIVSKQDELSELWKDRELEAFEEDEDGDIFKINYCNIFNSALSVKCIEFLKNAINNEESLESGIDNFINDKINGLSSLNPEKYNRWIGLDPNMPKVVKTQLLKFINGLQNKALYEAAKAKIKVSNPIYDKLRKFLIKVGTNPEMTVFDLLEQESKHIGTLESIGEYIRQDNIKEAIDGLISKLDLLKAVAYGMENVKGIDPDKQIGFNNQRRRYAEKYGLTINEGDFEVIDTEQVADIVNEIDLIQNKLKFLQTLNETNTLSKVGENNKTKEALQRALSSLVLSVPELTLDGVSIHVPIDELEKASTDEIKLGIFEHWLYTQVEKLRTEGHELKTLVADVFVAYGIKSEGVFAEGLYSAGLSRDLKSISAFDATTYFASILANDSHEFLAKYKDTISRESFKYVPLFTQEYAAKLEYAFATDKHGVFNTVLDILFGDKNSIKGIQKTKNIFFINGIAGAGKTTAVQSIVASMLSPRKTYIVGPNTKQAENLKKSVSTQATWLAEQDIKNKSELLNLFLTPDAIAEITKAVNGEKSEVLDIVKEGELSGYVSKISDKHLKDLDPEQIPKLIIIDEATHFNMLELDALSKASEKYGFKILTSGDTLQKGATINKFMSNINDVSAFKSPALTISVRSSNSVIKDNTDILQARLRKAEEFFQKYGDDLSRFENETKITLSDYTISYYENDAELNGTKFVQKFTKEDVQRIYEAAKKSGQKLGIIAALDEEGNIIDDVSNGNLKTILNDLGIKQSELDIYSPDSIHKQAVQGSEAPYFIIANMGDILSKDNYQKTIDLYTYLTRAQNGSLVLDLGSKLQEVLKIINSPKSFSGTYTLPGQNKHAELKNERIKIIDTIIGDYKYSEPEETTTKEGEESVTTKDGGSIKPKVGKSIKPDITTSVSEDELTEEEKQELNTLLAEGLTKADESAKDKKGENAVLPPSEKSESKKKNGTYVRGYSYITKLNASIVRNASHVRYKSTNFKNHLDLDGILGKYNVTIPDKIITGFKHFKNVLTLYPDVNSEQFKEAITNDDYIWQYLEKLYRIKLDKTKSEEERKNAVIALALDPETGIIIDSRPWIYAKKYNPMYDASYGSVGDHYEPGKIRFYTSYRITTKDSRISQFITTGALAQAPAENVNETYDKLIRDAEAKIKDTKDLAFYVLPEETRFDCSISTAIRKTPGKFYSIKELEKQYGIIFDRYQQSKLLDKLEVNLIKPDRATVNDIESFAFIHYVASVEPSNLSYADRIKQLEEAFVDNSDPNNPKLKVAGKYFAIAGLANTSDVTFKRVVILEPRGYTLKDALSYQSAQYYKMTHTVKTDEDIKGLFDVKMEALSMYSSIKVLREVFKALGAVDADGLPIGDGLKPYLQYVVDYLTREGGTFSGEANSSLKARIQNIPDIIKSWEADHGNKFGYDFLSYALKVTPELKVLLLDIFTKFEPETSTTKANLVARQLPNAETNGRTLVDVKIDLETPSYREYSSKAIKITKELGNGFIYSTVALNIDKADLDNIGLRHCIIQSPKFDLEIEDLQKAKPVETKVALGPDISNEDFVDLTTLESSVEGTKKEKRTESIQELAKTFNPNKQCTWRTTMPKHFYRHVFMDWDEQRQMAAYKTDPAISNGFEVRPGDIIQLCGDDTRNYEVSKVIERGHKLEFKSVDSESVEEMDIKPTAHWKDVSAIVHRNIPTYLAKGVEDKLSEENDYYNSKEWKDFVLSKKESLSLSAKVTNLTDFNFDGAENLIKSWSNPGALLVIPVTNSESSIQSVYKQAKDILETNPQADLGWEIVDITESSTYTKEQQIQELKAAVKKVSELSNLNGIIIVSLSGSGRFLSWATKRPEIVQELIKNDASYVRKYISFSDDPVFGKNDTSNIIVKKEKRKDNTAKEKSTDEIFKSVFSKMTSPEKVEEEFNYLQTWLNQQSVERLTRISKDANYVIVKTGAGYRICPNTSKLQEILPDKNLQKHILQLMKNMCNLSNDPLEVGNVLHIVKTSEILNPNDLDNTTSSYDIIEITDESIKLSYDSGRKIISKSKEDVLNRLGINYVITKQQPKSSPEPTPPINPSKPTEVINPVVTPESKKNPTPSAEEMNSNVVGFNVVAEKQYINIAPNTIDTQKYPEATKSIINKDTIIPIVEQLVNRVNLALQTIEQAVASQNLAEIPFEGIKQKTARMPLPVQVALWKSRFNQIRSKAQEVLSNLITSELNIIDIKDRLKLKDGASIEEIAQSIFNQYFVQPDFTDNVNNNCGY